MGRPDGVGTYHILAELPYVKFAGLSKDFNYDLEAMSSQEAREAFLSRVLEIDKGGYATTMKPTWLFAYASALDDARTQVERINEVLTGSDVPAESKRNAIELSWRTSAETLMQVCMFRAGKLAGQGRLLPAAK